MKRISSNLFINTEIDDKQKKMIENGIIFLRNKIKPISYYS